MVPVVTRAPNITNISCWKSVPNAREWFGYNPIILLNYYTFIHQSVPHCLRFYHCVSSIPIISKIVRFFHSFVNSCIGTICHHKDFTGRVLLWENFISPRKNLFHTQKNMFYGKVQILRMVQPIRSPENPGTNVVSNEHLTPWPENPG